MCPVYVLLLLSLYQWHTYKYIPVLPINQDKRTTQLYCSHTMVLLLTILFYNRLSNVHQDLGMGTSTKHTCTTGIKSAGSCFTCINRVGWSRHCQSVRAREIGGSRGSVGGQDRHSGKHHTKKKRSVTPGIEPGREIPSVFKTDALTTRPCHPKNLRILTLPGLGHPATFHPSTHCDIMPCTTCIPTVMCVSNGIFLVVKGGQKRRHGVDQVGAWWSE